MTHNTRTQSIVGQIIRIRLQVCCYTHCVFSVTYGWAVFGVYATRPGPDHYDPKRTRWSASPMKTQVDQIRTQTMLIVNCQMDQSSRAMTWRPRLVTVTSYCCATSLQGRKWRHYTGPSVMKAPSLTSASAATTSRLSEYVLNILCCS